MALLDGDIADTGAAYVFAYENGSWRQQAKLTADTGASGDQFGFFVGLSGNTAVVGTPQDDDAGSNAGSAYTFVASGSGGGGGLQTTTIVYSYDPLYRLTNASYTGTLSGTYSYTYDAVGNRLSFNTNVTNTQTVSYTYDAANRLVESVDLTSNDVTTYAWDNANRLITTTVNGQIGKLYSYSQDGNLLQAVVDGVTTTFAYDGNGQRLQMSVDGVTTTYTLDYAADFQPLLETGGSSFTSKHYLYGVACIAEIVDEGRPEEETRYYHRDGNGLVRQTTNQSEEITYAWTYSPEGAVILGPEGPVTRLDCGDNAIYDWSTGLIFRNGSYFDPNTGIWITLGGLVVWDGWQYGRKWRSKRKRRILFLLFGFVIILSLAGCGGSPGTTTLPPTATCAPTSQVPSPTLPPPVISTVPAPNTPTPWPTSPPRPTNTPVSPTPTSIPSINNLSLFNPFGAKQFLVTTFYGEQQYGYQQEMGDGQGVGHAGIDVVTLDYALESKRNGYMPTPNHRKLFAPISGIVTRYPYDHKLVITTTVREGEASVELLHVDPNQGPQTGAYVRAGQPLQAMTFKGKGYGTDFPHLHLGLHNSKIYRDPLPIPGYIGNYWTYIDPDDGLYFTQLPEGS